MPSTPLSTPVASCTWSPRALSVATLVIRDSVVPSASRSVSNLCPPPSVNPNAGHRR